MPIGPLIRYAIGAVTVLMLASCSVGLTFGVFIGHAIQTTGP